MPNQFQYVFVSSFALTFAVLVFVSQVITAKLREAGYPISHLILLGLDKKNDKSQQATMSLATPVLFLTVSFVLLTIIYTRFLRSRT